MQTVLRMPYEPDCCCWKCKIMYKVVLNTTTFRQHWSFDAKRCKIQLCVNENVSPYEVAYQQKWQKNKNSACCAWSCDGLWSHNAFGRSKVYFWYFSLSFNGASCTFLFGHFQWVELKLVIAFKMAKTCKIRSFFFTNRKKNARRMKSNNKDLF